MDVIGLDIGGTKCSVVKSDENGHFSFKETFQTTTVTETLERLFSVIEKAKPLTDPIFGIACGDPMDKEKGIILSPPNLPDWDHVTIVDDIVSRFGGKAFLMNDANAGALAEWKFGAGKGYDNVAFLTYGTGMGAGLVLNGRLYEGKQYAAGEVGHIRLAPDGPIGYGKHGSFEGFCSGGGIAKWVQILAAEGENESVLFKNKELYDITAKDVAEAARAGDAFAADIFYQSGRHAGQALSTIIDILNPEVIILGSLYARCQDLLEKPIREVLEQETLARPLSGCKIVPTALGEKIGDYAAISIALYGVEMENK